MNNNLDYGCLEYDKDKFKVHTVGTIEHVTFGIRNCGARPIRPNYP